MEVGTERAVLTTGIQWKRRGAGRTSTADSRGVGQQVAKAPLRYGAVARPLRLRTKHGRPLALRPLPSPGCLLLYRMGEVGCASRRPLGSMIIIGQVGRERKSGGLGATMGPRRARARARARARRRRHPGSRFEEDDRAEFRP